LLQALLLPAGRQDPCFDEIASDGGNRCVTAGPAGAPLDHLFGLHFALEPVVAKALPADKRFPSLLRILPGSTVFTRFEAHSEREKPLTKGFLHSEARQNPEIA